MLFKAKPELRHLCRLPLGDWYAVGLKLGINNNDLEAAEKEHWGKTTNQIREMFRLWLRRDDKATYKKLIEVLLRKKETESAKLLAKQIGWCTCLFIVTLKSSDLMSQRFFYFFATAGVSLQDPPPNLPGPTIGTCIVHSLHISSTILVHVVQ